MRINCIPIHPKEGYIYNYSATLPYSHLDKMVTFVITKVVIVTGTPRFCHVRPLLFQLHWFPISYCIKFKILLLTFKCLCGLAPNYFNCFASYLVLRPIQPLTIMHSSQCTISLECVTFDNLQHKDIGHFQDCC